LIRVDIIKCQVFFFYFIFLHRFLTNLASTGRPHEISRRAACGLNSTALGHGPEHSQGVNGRGTWGQQMVQVVTHRQFGVDDHSADSHCGHPFVSSDNWIIVTKSLWPPSEDNKCFGFRCIELYCFAQPIARCCQYRILINTWKNRKSFFIEIID